MLKGVSIPQIISLAAIAIVGAILLVQVTQAGWDISLALQVREEAIAGYAIASGINALAVADGGKIVKNFEKPRNVIIDGNDISIDDNDVDDIVLAQVGDEDSVVLSQAEAVCITKEFGQNLEVEKCAKA